MTAAELLPPDELTLGAAGEALAHRFSVRDGRVYETDRSYYDTFDGLLHGAGLTLVYGDGALSLVDRGTGVARARLSLGECPAGPLFARELPAGPLREALLELTEPRALLRLADVHGRERPLDVLDEQSKTVVRLTVCEPGELRPRLRVSAVRGYDAARERVLDVLERELGFRPVDQPLVDEALRALGAAPGGISSKVDLTLDPEEPADRAATAVLRRLLEVIECNLDGTLADVDSEFLHDLRVAVRRTRSVQRELKRVFAPAPLAHFRAEFRWLQQVTGDSRDLDVYVLEFDRFRAMVPAEMGGQLEPLLDVLGERRVQAHGAMNRALCSERAVSLLAQWSRFLDELPGSDATERADAARPIGSLAAGRIASVYRTMRRMGDAIDDSSPPEAYHELRKKGKELRYLLELFGAPLFPGEVVKPMVRTLKALQDVLGRHQDREIQINTLRSLAPEVARRPGGTEALLVMGALMQRLGEDELAARAAFAERFAAFVAKPQRTLVRETFAT